MGKNVLHKNFDLLVKKFEGSSKCHVVIINIEALIVWSKTVFHKKICLFIKFRTLLSEPVWYKALLWPFLTSSGKSKEQGPGIINHRS